jgi:hypothetical protein
MYHYLESIRFERDLRFLKANGYRTLNGDEFLERLESNSNSLKEVLLTFDDGQRSLWHTAYPLLREYGMRGVAFVIVSRVTDKPKSKLLWPTEEQQRSEFQQMNNAAEQCSWDELLEMQNSGVLDIQSHSFHHALVYSTDRIYDFVNPSYLAKYDALRTNFLVQENNQCFVLGRESFGAPIYGHYPLLLSNVWYHDDPAIREECIEYARSMGDGFIGQPGWKKKMLRYYRSINRFGQLHKGSFQRQLGPVIREDLAVSRRILEQKLSRKIEHLCLPFGVAGKQAVDIATEEGYKVIYSVKPLSDVHPRSSFLMHRYNGDKGELPLKLKGRGRLALILFGIQDRLRRTLYTEY